MRKNLRPDTGMKIHLPAILVHQGYHGFTVVLYHFVPWSSLRATAHSQRSCEMDLQRIGSSTSELGGGWAKYAKHIGVLGTITIYVFIYIYMERYLELETKQLFVA